MKEVTCWGRLVWQRGRPKDGEIGLFGVRGEMPASHDAAAFFEEGVEGHKVPVIRKGRSKLLSVGLIDWKSLDFGLIPGTEPLILACQPPFIASNEDFPVLWAVVRAYKAILACPRTVLRSKQAFPKRHFARKTGRIGAVRLKRL